MVAVKLQGFLGFTHEVWSEAAEERAPLAYVVAVVWLIDWERHEVRCPTLVVWRLRAVWAGAPAQAVWAHIRLQCSETLQC